MDETEIQYLDQTIRDAQQSLWRFRMPTDIIMPIASMMDRGGYKTMGVVAGRSAKDMPLSNTGRGINIRMGADDIDNPKYWSNIFSLCLGFVFSRALSYSALM
ncbi:MAG: hypothetical protein KG012_01145 [Deltaproteobacteria bacterium]|nr:hypothetical protein [Deltaproteobacteria bacterium]